MTFSRVSFATRTAKNKRKNNEDNGAGMVVYQEKVEPVSLLRRKSSTISYNTQEVIAAGAIVADGLGGHSQGELASRIAKNSFIGTAKNFDWENGILPQFLSNFYRKAQGKITALKSDSSTTVASAVVDRNKNLHIGYAGDSRIYLVRGNTVYLLTRDHNEATGALKDKAKDACFFDRKDGDIESVMTNCLFRESAGLDFKMYELPKPKMHRNDTLILMTDGASVFFHGQNQKGKRKRYGLRELVKKTNNLGEAAEEIIKISSDYQDDNATVIMMKIE